MERTREGVPAEKGVSARLFFSVTERERDRFHTAPTPSRSVIPAFGHSLGCVRWGGGVGALPRTEAIHSIGAPTRSSKSEYQLRIPGLEGYDLSGPPIFFGPRNKQLSSSFHDHPFAPTRRSGPYPGETSWCPPVRARRTTSFSQPVRERIVRVAACPRS